MHNNIKLKEILWRWYIPRLWTANECCFFKFIYFRRFDAAFGLSWLLCLLHLLRGLTRCCCTDALGCDERLGPSYQLEPFCSVFSAMRPLFTFSARRLSSATCRQTWCTPELAECQSGWQRQSHFHAAPLAPEHIAESHALHQVLFPLSVWETSLRRHDLIS